MPEPAVDVAATVTLTVNGKEIPGHIDDLFHDPEDGEWAVVEVKSVTQQGIREFNKDPLGWSQKWGYLGQAARYAKALDATMIRFVLICRDTGDLDEWAIATDSQEVLAEIEDTFDAYTQIMASKEPEDIPRAYETEPEMTKVQGRHKIPSEVDPRDVVQSGSWFYWPSGRQVLGVRCGYCPWNSSCWTGAKMEVKSGKPVWVMEAS